MDRNNPTTSSTTEDPKLTTTSDEAATIAGLEQRVAELTAQLEVATRSGAETQHDNTYSGYMETNDDGIVAMDWEPWVNSLDPDSRDFGMENNQEQSAFINDASLIQTTPDTFHEVPSTWHPSNSDQVALDDPIFGEAYLESLESNLNSGMSYMDNQYNPNDFLDIRPSPIAVPDSHHSSSLKSEAHGVRARRTVLSAAQKTTLENWIMLHTDPYPKKQDKESYPS
ncbi:hypothetical protein F4782DRAFT_536305 [Xylaria castorea]|nr:hypothetical protein F4782DRAFT_536305 [Xylaria castorea]